MDKTPWIVCFVACVCVEEKDLWYSWLKVSVWNCIYDKMTGIRNNILTCLYDTWWMRSLLFGTVWVFGVHSIMVKVKKNRTTQVMNVVSPILTKMATGQ